MKIAFLVLVVPFVIIGAGCGEDSASSATTDEVVAAVERFHPDATDISCQSSGAIYECTAVVDGDRVVYRARANSDGVYLNSSPGQGDQALSAPAQAALQNAETASEGGDLHSEGVPASQCPEAVEAMTAAGSPPSSEDHFSPDCDAGFAIAEAIREAEARRR
jgi:hypothetical protein